MARTRAIKPGLFANEELAELGPVAMLLFAGLPTLADREGRLADRPKRIKAQLFPYFEIDVDGLLNALAAKGFILRYDAAGERYIQIVDSGEFFGHGPKASHLNAERSSLAYRRWRAAVLDRDDWRRQSCGAGIDDGPLHAHHVESFASCADLRFDVSNGVTLCTHCHRAVHRKRTS